jgi:hypothetical protein
METQYVLFDNHTGEIVRWTLEEVLEELNRNRSEGWIPYDETDFEDALERFTEYTLIAKTEPVLGSLYEDRVTVYW